MAPDPEAIKKRMAEVKNRDTSESDAAPREPITPDKPPVQLLQKSTAAQLEHVLKYNQEPEDNPDLMELDEIPEGADLTGIVDKYHPSQFPMGSKIDNPRVRKAVEGRCEPMDFGDLIISGRVQQEVPILPEKLSANYQTLSGSEIFWIEQTAPDMSVTDFGINAWMGYARLVMSLTGVNGSTFSPYGEKRGTVDKAMFAQRFEEVMGLGEQLIELLLVNLKWFRGRVDELFVDDLGELKNG